MIIPKIKFIFDRKNVANKKVKGVIDLRIYYGGKQKFISTGLSVFPNEWSEREEVVYAPEAPAYNRTLHIIKGKVMKILEKMTDEGKIDLNAIPQMMKADKVVDVTFIEYVYRRIQERDVTFNTKRAYGVFFSKFTEYGKIKTFSDISEKNIRDFDSWLHKYSWKEKDKDFRDVTRKYSQASIGSFHKNLKSFIADAVLDGYITDNPYVNKRIKIDKGGTRIDKFLTPDEIEKIKKAVMTTPEIERVRDLFVFACMTGISYSDLMEFNPKSVHDVDGLKMYTDERVKTKQPFTCIIPADAMAILRKYKGKLPRITNQKYNARLKVVALLAGIDKPITTHYARHSAAMMWLNNGIPLEVVARCLGHSAISTTVKSYAEITDRAIADAFAKAEEKKRK